MLKSYDSAYITPLSALVTYGEAKVDGAKRRGYSPTARGKGKLLVSSRN